MSFKDSFPGGIIGKVDAVDEDIFDELTYEIINFRWIISFFNDFDPNGNIRMKRWCSEVVGSNNKVIHVLYMTIKLSCCCQNTLIGYKEFSICIAANNVKGEMLSICWREVVLQ
jgi:hypothetical protein